MEKSGILLQFEKAAETNNGDITCYLFSLEDAAAHLSVTDSSGILNIEKQIKKFNSIKIESHMQDIFGNTNILKLQPPNFPSVKR